MGTGRRWFGRLYKQVQTRHVFYSWYSYDDFAHSGSNRMADLAASAQANCHTLQPDGRGPLDGKWHATVESYKSINTHAMPSLLLVS